MREFFKPWPRKVGCVTLVMACVLMAGWVRSLIVNDQIPLFTDNCKLRSSDGHVSLCLYLTAEAWKATPIRFENGVGYFASSDTKPNIWRFYCFGFTADVSRGQLNGSRVFEICTTYDNGVIPLTLVSACLLIGHDAKRKA